jgi:hypothetical protein
MRGSKRSREATEVRADGAVLVKKSHPGCGVKDPVEILFRFSNVFADDERQVEALRVRVQHHWQSRPPLSSCLFQMFLRIATKFTSVIEWRVTPELVPAFGRNGPLFVVARRSQ